MNENKNKNFWVGVKKEYSGYKGTWMFDSAAEERKANFSEMIYQWVEGQPDNSDQDCASENCVMLIQGKGWNDVRCDYMSDNMHGLCEIDEG